MIIKNIEILTRIKDSLDKIKRISLKAIKTLLIFFNNVVRSSIDRDLIILEIILKLIISKSLSIRDIFFFLLKISYKRLKRESSTIDLKSINNNEKKYKEDKENRSRELFIKKYKYRYIIIRLLIYFLTLNIILDK